MPESITQFYKRIQSCDLQPDATYSMEKPYFNIFSRQCNFGTVQFGYREFYKITLIIGVGKLYYADKWILVDRPALLFSNPLVPYAWESISEEQKGMDIYKQMQEENQSDYINKSDVLRCYLHLLVHTALKMQDSNQYESHPNASQRITELFIELLDRQFPVDYPNAILSLRTPADYANRLSVHVNHLNKVVKEITGKTTSEMIAERIIKECTQHLLHTNLSISEIAYSLGFETVSYFSKFYRKHTGKSPSEVREQAII